MEVPLYLCVFECTYVCVCVYVCVCAGVCVPTLLGSNKADHKSTKMHTHTSDDLRGHVSYSAYSIGEGVL